MMTQLFIPGSVRDSRADFGDLAEISSTVSCAGKFQQVAVESPATARESSALPR